MGRDKSLREIQDKQDNLQEDIQRMRDDIGYVNGESISKRVSDAEKDIQYLQDFKVDMKKGFKGVNERIDGIIRWLVIGLGGLSLNLIVQIILMLD